MSEKINVDLYKSKISKNKDSMVLEGYLTEIDNHFVGRIQEIKVEYGEFLKKCLMKIYRDKKAFLRNYNDFVKVSDEYLWDYEVYQLMFQEYQDCLENDEYEETLRG